MNQGSFPFAAPPSLPSRPAPAVPTGTDDAVLDWTRDPKGAVIVADWRYLLWRTVEGSTDTRVCLWGLCNPSKADAVDEDLTVTKCLGFAGRWGYGRVLVVNPLAYRGMPEKVAADAARGVDVVGPDNAAWVRWALAQADRIVVGWGMQTFLAETHVRTFLRDLPAGRELLCLGTTADGSPRHPSRLAYATPLSPYSPPWEKNQ